LYEEGITKKMCGVLELREMVQNNNLESHGENNTGNNTAVSSSLHVKYTSLYAFKLITTH
jgi:hypothetical protein